MNHNRTLSLPIKFRSAADGKPPIVSGHAAVYNQLSEPLWELAGGRELILPGAFAESLADPTQQVVLLINHDSNLILARNTSGTLTLTEDEIGLYFEAMLGAQSYAKDLAISMERGDISKCSFAFAITDSENRVIDGEKVQIIKSARVSDVSLVVSPAYTSTDATVRAALRQYLKTPDALNSDAEPLGVPKVKAVDVSADLWREQAEGRKRLIEILRLQ